MKIAPVAAWLAAKSPDLRIATQVPDDPQPLGIGFGKNKPALLAAVNGALVVMQRDGSINRLKNKWGVPCPAVRRRLPGVRRLWTAIEQRAGEELDGVNGGVKPGQFAVDVKARCAASPRRRWPGFRSRGGRGVQEARMVLPISTADEGERLNQLAAERHLAESVAGPLRAQQSGWSSPGRSRTEVADCLSGRAWRGPIRGLPAGPSSPNRDCIKADRPHRHIPRNLAPTSTGRALRLDARLPG
jgi:Bacterial extracellular solute-binding proteins, family 3